jgi:hypothetical protein
VTSNRDDAVLLDSAGNVFVGLAAAATTTDALALRSVAPTDVTRSAAAQAAEVPTAAPPQFGQLALSLRNFDTGSSGACSPGQVLLAPAAPNVTYWPVRATPTAAIICVTAASGVWYAAALGTGNPDTPTGTWKYSHGGLVAEIRAPRSRGWDPAEDKKDFWFTEFHVADPFGAGELVPLACNGTAQHQQPTAVCAVMPPNRRPYFDPHHFEANPPARKSTNVNLWDAWSLRFAPLLSTGQFGVYDSADLVQAAFMFDRLSAVGVSFFITDNTNGLGCDFGNTYAATRALAALAARRNVGGFRNASKMYYALSVGVNPLGSPTDPATLHKMDAQLLTIWGDFLNATDAEAATIDGNSGGGGGGGGSSPCTGAELAAAAFRHPTTRKPVVVLYVEPSFEPLYDAYLRANASSVGNRFHIGYSDGNNWRPNLWGWMIDRSCGPPHSPAVPCGSVLPPTVDVGLRPGNNTMYISPAFAKTELDPATNTTYAAYAARDIGWYRSTFSVVAKACPVVLVVGGFNDYTEMNCWWPSECAECADAGTADDRDPFLFWNATVDGLAMVRQKCA